MKKYFYLLVVILYIVLLNSILFSQGITENNIKDYIEEHGLKVNDIAYHSSSYWISTYYGLIKSDGTSFKYYLLNEDSDGPLDMYSMSQDTSDSRYRILYNLYSNNDDLWVIPQYSYNRSNHLCVFKIRNNNVYKYKVFVEGFDKEFNIDRMIFDGNNSPVLVVRNVFRNGGSDLMTYDIYSLDDEKFYKKNIILSPDENVYSILYFKGHECTLIQEKTDKGFILKLRYEEMGKNVIILDTSNEIHRFVKSYNFQDSILLVTFSSNSNSMLFSMNSMSDYKFIKADTKYPEESEGVLIRNKFFGLFKIGIFEYDFRTNSFKRYEINNCQACSTTIDSKIREIRGNLWCLFGIGIGPSKNNNLFLHKY